VSRFGRAHKAGAAVWCTMRRSSKRLTKRWRPGAMRAFKEMTA